MDPNDITFTTEFDKIGSLTKQDEQLRIKLVGENADEDVIEAYNQAFKIDELYSLHRDYAMAIIQND